MYSDPDTTGPEREAPGPEEGRRVDFTRMGPETHRRKRRWDRTAPRLKLCAIFPSLLSMSQDPLSLSSGSDCLSVCLSVCLSSLSEYPSCLSVFLPTPVRCIVSVCFNVSVFLLQVTDKGSLTSEEFAKLLGLSVLLSKERSVSAVLRPNVFFRLPF